MGPVEQQKQRGFTLIELSIVLVIIGLIVGGVLAGQDLIRAAGVRAQVSQIEKFNTAVNTFRDKYGYLPGDITAVAAQTFGFLARSGGQFDGDGDGLIIGCEPSSRFGCETALFWLDLATAQLIEGTFPGITDWYNIIPASGPTDFLPAAKIGKGNYLAVYTGNAWMGNDAEGGIGVNYFFLGGIKTSVGWDYAVDSDLSVGEAYAIDQKMDDGMPQSGRVMTVQANGGLWFDKTYGTGNCAVSATSYNLANSNLSACQLSFQFQ